MTAPLKYKFPVHSFTRQALMRLGLRLVKREVESGRISLPPEAERETDKMLRHLSKLILLRKRALTTEMQGLADLSGDGTQS